MATHFIARGLRTSMWVMKNHYDTLGLSPSASQAEVKAAYYKKSMELHPDRVQGNREGFEDVANAYKILSDPSIRKSYDKRQGVKEGQKCDPRPKKRFGPQFGKTPVYDFDRWTRVHYGATSKRQRARKHEPATPNFHDDQRENVTMALTFFIIICVGFLSAVNADQPVGAKRAPKRAT